MPLRIIILTLVAMLLILGTSKPGLSENAKSQPKAAAKGDAAGNAADKDGVARYCAIMGPAVAEIRLARQMKRLTELDATVQAHIQQLDEKERQAREWVNRRQAMLQQASDGIVAIFGKMDAEAAAARLALSEDETAAAVLVKLPARSAGAILNEMEASRAARLASLISATTSSVKKP